MTKVLHIGSRGSKLALAQTQIVIDSLTKLDDSFDYEVHKIKTKGDLDNNKPLFYLDRKGIFEKEINESVVKGDIDFAIHSLKDLPASLHPDLTIASIPKRESVNDVLISKKKRQLDQLPSGSTIGTSSLRRAIQIISLRNDCKVIPIRGNIDTRIEKALKGDYDGIVLAEAGLNRLGKEEYISEIFNIETILPAPGQGAIAIVCKKSNKKVVNLLKKIEDHQSRISINTERSFTSTIEGGCRFPIAAFANLSEQKNKINFYAKIFSTDGLEHMSIKKVGNYNESVQLGKMAANSLIQNGALRLAESWENAINEWNKL